MKFKTLQDIDLWLNHPKYSISEAAHLICDHKPGTVTNTDPDYLILRKYANRLIDEGFTLKEKDKLLPIKENFATRELIQKTIKGESYTTTELISKFCEENKLRPKFLYPDKIANDDKLNSWPWGEY